ncbi:MAG TPA: hypothetical protein VGS09_01190 [Actinomycetota bacterium]|jgi:hypothetical protein|nr:hypothetical protein [Actinomycetota bacterium]
MPASRQPGKTRAGVKRRDKAAEARARETRAAQRRAEEGQLTLPAYRRRRLLGWSLVTPGVIVGVQHFISHLGVFSLISPGSTTSWRAIRLPGCWG